MLHYSVLFSYDYTVTTYNATNSSSKPVAAVSRIIASDIYSACRVMKVAKTFLDQGKKLSFAVANKNIFSHDLSELGLDSSSGELPVVGIRTAKGDKYVMQDEFT